MGQHFLTKFNNFPLATKLPVYPIEEFWTGMIKSLLSAFLMWVRNSCFRSVLDSKIQQIIYGVVWNMVWIGEGKEWIAIKKTEQ